MSLPLDQRSITMLYKKLTALALFIYAATTAPATAASKRYIVTLKDNASRATHLSSITNRLSAASRVTHEWDIINGFAGAFAEEDLKVLRGDPRVQSIEEDGTVGTAALVTQYVTVHSDSNHGI